MIEKIKSKDSKVHKYIGIIFVIGVILLGIGIAHAATVNTEGANWLDDFEGGSSDGWYDGTGVVNIGYRTNYSYEGEPGYRDYTANPENFDIYAIIKPDSDDWSTFRIEDTDKSLDAPIVEVSVNPSETWSYVRVYDNDGSTDYDFGSVTDTWQVIRLKGDSGTVYAKVWEAGTGEPSNWEVSGSTNFASEDFDRLQIIGNPIRIDSFGTYDPPTNLTLSTEKSIMTEGTNQSFELLWNGNDVTDSSDSSYSYNSSVFNVYPSNKTIVANKGYYGTFSFTGEYYDSNTGSTYTDTKQITVEKETNLSQVYEREKMYTKGEQNFSIYYNGNNVTSHENTTYTYNTTVFNLSKNDGILHANEGYNGTYFVTTEYYDSEISETSSVTKQIKLYKANYTMEFSKDHIVDRERVNFYWNTYFNGSNVEPVNETIANETVFKIDPDGIYIEPKDNTNGTYNITTRYTVHGTDYWDSDTLHVFEGNYTWKFDKEILKVNETTNYELWFNHSINENVTNETEDIELHIRNSNYENHIEFDKNNSTVTGLKTGKFEVYSNFFHYDEGESNTLRQTTKEVVVSNQNLTFEVNKTTLDIGESTQYYAYYDGKNVTENVSVISGDSTVLSVDENNTLLKANNQGYTSSVLVNVSYTDTTDTTHYTEKTINVINESTTFDFIIGDKYTFGGESRQYYATFNENYVQDNVTVTTNTTGFVEVNYTDTRIDILENKSGYVNITGTYENDGTTYTDYEIIYVNNKEFNLTLTKNYLNGSETADYTTYLDNTEVNADSITANNSLVDITYEIEANESGSGYVRVTANYTDSDGIEYEDYKDMYIHNLNLNLTVEQKYLKNKDTQNYTVTYDIEVTDSTNLTMRNEDTDLITIFESNNTLLANSENSGYATIIADYENSHGYNYTSEVQILVDTKELRLRATNYMYYGDAVKYTIKYGDKTITNNATIQSNNTLLVTINTTGNLLEATENKSRKGKVDILVNYTDEYGYETNITRNIFIGNRSIENIDYLPPALKGFVILENTKFQALLFLFTAGIGVSLMVNAYAGILGVVLGIGIGLIGGIFSLGYFVIALIGGTFMFLNTDIRFKDGI